MKLSRRMFINRSGVFAAIVSGVFGVGCRSVEAQQGSADKKPYLIHSIGKIVKKDRHTEIVLDKKYLPAMLRVDKLKHITVVYWFDRNDTPEKRSVMQVHPQGNKKNPLTGVFATHSPVRPNLIAITRCKIISVKENVIEIDKIDAFHDSPVIDLKS